MGLLDFFNKKPDSDSHIDALQSVLDDPSKSTEEKNVAYLAMREEEERRLNKVYDFNSIQGIRNIPVPCKEVNKNSITGKVEYYLRGKCFSMHRDAGNIDLAIECIKKAHDLMFVSSTPWNYDSFISSISWLHSIGKHEEARLEEKRIDDYFQKVGFYYELTKENFPDTDSFIAWKKSIEEIENERLRKRNLRHEYYWLQEYLPDRCPKSLSSYSRMKNSNSKNYQKLVDDAAKLGTKL